MAEARDCPRGDLATGVVSPKRSGELLEMPTEQTIGSFIEACLVAAKLVDDRFVIDLAAGEYVVSNSCEGHAVEAPARHELGLGV